MPISENFTSILIKEFEINFMQCTPSGFLKYVELCNMLQIIAAEHSAIGGISFIDMQKFNLAWVLSRMRVEADEMPKWRDTITIKTWICTLENSRSVRAFDIYLNNKKIIGCETFWAVFNTKSRRPESLSLPHEHFEKFPDNRSTKILFSKIAIPENSQNNFQKTVRLSDLDIVNHVNNVKYLEWCLDLVDADLVLKNKIRSFEMNFMKELSLNDQVKISSFQENSSLKFAIFKDEKISFALQLNFD